MKLRAYISLLFILIQGAALYAEEPDSVSSGFAPDEIYLVFDYKNAFNSNITCLANEDKIFLPVKDIFDLLNVSCKQSGSTFTGSFLTSDKRYSINLTQGNVSFADNSIDFTTDDYFIQDNIVYLSSEVFSKGFDLNFNYDMENMRLKMETNQIIPVIEKRKREQVRESIEQEAEDENKTVLLFDRSRSFFKGQFLDYYLSSSYAKDLNPSYQYDFRSGVELLGGDLSLGLSGNHSSLTSGFDADAKWRYVLGENKLINQISLGTKINGPGLSNLNLTGVHINNAPFQPENNFGSYTLVERTQPNSDVELYINNELTDYVKSDVNGDFKFVIPLAYGSNNIELKIYSPEGELIENNRRINIPFDFLKEGDFIYNSVIGKKEDDGFASQTEAAYGIASWLTNKAGVEYQSDYKKPVFYNSLSARIGSDYMANFIAAPLAFYRVSLMANYYNMQSFNLTYTSYKENNIYNVRKLKEDIQLSAALPFEMLGKHSMQLTGTIEKGDIYKNYRLNLSSNFSFFDISPTLTYNFEESKIHYASNVRRDISFGFNAPLLLLNGIMPFFDGKYLNSTMKYDLIDKQMSAYKIAFSTSISSNSRLEINYKNEVAADFSSVNMMFKYEFPFTTANINASKQHLTANINGSFSYDTERKVVGFTKRESVGTSAVNVKMYFDENGNKVYDTGEMILDDVNPGFDNQVSWSRESDGTLTISELSPYYRYKGILKDLSPKNPFLVPRYDNFAFITDPNSVKQIEIPFYFSREVYGNVIAVKNGTEFPLPDMHVTIRDVNYGNSYKISSFNDGTLYYMGLLPGKYEAEIEEEQLTILGVKADKVKFEIFEESSETPEINFVLNMGSPDIENEKVLVDLEAYRKKFEFTEKKINSKTGTPEEAHKEYFDEIEANAFVNLPEFYQRYLDMKDKLDKWKIKPEETEKGYTVVRGDCLWKISGMKQHYNTPHLWPAIWEANKNGIISAPDGVKNVIPNPNLIYPKQVLRIPNLTEEQKNDVLSKEPEYNRTWHKKFK